MKEREQQKILEKGYNPLPDNRVHCPCGLVEHSKKNKKRNIRIRDARIMRKTAKARLSDSQFTTLN
jgi:hypothetical protein